MSISKWIRGLLPLVLLAALPVQAATIKIATVSPDGSVWMKNLRAAAAEVSERTAGRVKWTAPRKKWCRIGDSNT